MHYDIELLASAWEELDRIADIHLNLVGVKSVQEITDKFLILFNFLPTIHIWELNLNTPK